MENEFDNIDKIISSPNDAAQADLERKVTKEQHARKEERFLWMLAVLILLDVFFFTMVNSWGAICILILEIILLVLLAEKCGIKEFALLVQKIIYPIFNRNDKN